MFEKRYTANCRIYNMLNDAPRHTSFHTPGHKKGKWDITELDFSDNLAAPTGVIKQAQEEIASVLGASVSYILTDGSTSGVLAMLYASGVKKLIFPIASHKSVYNGCRLLGVEGVILPTRTLGKIPQQPTAKEVEIALKESGADGVLITSPDYYGNVADLSALKAVCQRHGALLLCDGAHGAHLHGTPLYAGNFADMWVDGVHKSLPACTQGAVLSAKEQRFKERLLDGVDIFRTTSPNYIIMASVEYAVKYPVSPRLVAAANGLKQALNAYENDDWSKLLVHYGENATKVHEYLQSLNVYPEFCDGENILFYLSPANKISQIERLKAVLLPLKHLQSDYTLSAPMPENKRGERTEKYEQIPLASSVGRTSAKNVGLFPPCIPVVAQGEIIEQRHVERLQSAKNTFGLTEGKITVYL